jgi:succinoglycan biosynthesis protein ExoM
MDISICINTYKRPQLLYKLLTSLINQNLPSQFEIEIIIVDNDNYKSGQIVVNDFVVKSKIKINYDVEPIKNISLARNRAVSKAIGKYICFIDDDEFADNNWISTMYNCLINYDADAAFGKVLPYYEKGVPNWMIQGNFFQYHIQSTGEISTYTRTSNAIIKANIVKSIEGPFDSKYGLTGGEDTNLFETLRKRGSKMIFCAEGIVHDFIPISRANLNWLQKRYYRSGITNTAQKIVMAKSPTVAKIYLTIKYLTYLPISILILIAVFPFKLKKVYWRLKIFGILGHLAAICNLKYEEYK